MKEASAILQMLLATYDRIVKYSIESAKKAYFDNTFIIYKNDTKKTWFMNP